MNSKLEDEYFNSLGNELMKHFSIKDVRDILNDYRTFFQEKNLEKRTSSEIIAELGSIQNIVNELLTDDISKASLLQKLISKKINQLILFIIWLLLSLVFLSMSQWSSLTLYMGAILTGLQISLFWFVFSYKSITLRSQKDIPVASIVKISLLSMIPIVLTFYNLYFMYQLSYNRETANLIKTMDNKFIGPYTHYQLIISIIIIFIILYYIFIKHINLEIHLSTTFLYVSSIFIMIVLHSWLNNMELINILRRQLQYIFPIYCVITFTYYFLQLTFTKKYRR